MAINLIVFSVSFLFILNFNVGEKMGSKINDKSFSFLGDWSETIMRSVFIALVGVAVIALIVCIIWAKSQNMVEEDPQ